MQSPKYRLGSLTVQNIGMCVRVTVSNVGGPGAKDRVKCTETLTAAAVADVVRDLRELPGGAYLDRATLTICGRAAKDARDEKEASELCL